MGEKRHQSRFDKTVLPISFATFLGAMALLMCVHLFIADVYVYPTGFELIQARIHLTIAKLPSILLRIYSINGAIENMKVGENYLSNNLWSPIVDIIGWILIGVLIGFLINWLKARKTRIKTGV